MLDKVIPDAKNLAGFQDIVGNMRFARAVLSIYAAPIKTLFVYFEVVIGEMIRKSLAVQKEWLPSQLQTL